MLSLSLIFLVSLFHLEQFLFSCLSSSLIFFLAVSNLLVILFSISEIVVFILKSNFDLIHVFLDMFILYCDFMCNSVIITILMFLLMLRSPSLGVVFEWFSLPVVGFIRLVQK